MVHGIGFRVHGGHVVKFEIGKQVRERFFVIDEYVFFVLQHYSQNVTNYAKRKEMVAVIVGQMHILLYLRP